MRRRSLLVLLLVAATGAQSAYESFPLSNWTDLVIAGELEAAVLAEDSYSALSGRTLKVCGDFAVHPPSSSFYAVVQSDALLRAFNATPANRAMALLPSDVTGVVPYLLSTVCALANCSLQYFWPKPSASLEAALHTSSLAQLVAFESGCDIYASPTLFLPPRRTLYRSSNPLQDYHYVLIAPRAAVPVDSLYNKLWNWLDPFTWQLWLVLIGSVVISSGFFLFLEHGSTSEDSMVSLYRGGSHPRISRLVHSLFQSVVCLTTVIDHEPTMFASRLFVSAKALTLWIVMASYLASLAAKLTNRPLPVQVITDWTVFAANDWTLCVKNESVTLSTMQSFYPSVPIQPIGSGSAREVMDAVLSGKCHAGMAPNTEFQSLFAQDTGGVYCSLDYVAQPSYMTFFNALPITPNVTSFPHAALEAFNQAMDTVFYSGNLSLYSNTQLFATRPLAQCDAYFQSVSLDPNSFVPLGVTDLAGLFIVQLAVALVAVALHSGKLVARHAKEAAARRRGKGGEGLGALELPRSGKGVEEGATGTGMSRLDAVVAVAERAAAQARAAAGEAELAAAALRQEAAQVAEAPAKAEGSERL